MFSGLNTFSRLFKLFSHDPNHPKNPYAIRFVNYGLVFDPQIIRNFKESQTYRVQEEIRAEFKNEWRDLPNKEGARW